MFQQEGAQSLFFLYAREKFGWTLEDFSVFIIVITINMIIGAQIGLWLKRKFNLSDTKTAILTTTTLIVSNVLNAASTKSWQLYVGKFLLT